MCGWLFESILRSLQQVEGFVVQLQQTSTPTAYPISPHRFIFFDQSFHPLFQPPLMFLDSLLQFRVLHRRISGGQLMHGSLRTADHIYLAIELHLVVVVLQYLLDPQGILVLGESLQGFAQTADALVVGHVHAVLQVADGPLLVVVELCLVVGQLDVQSVAVGLRQHFLGGDQSGLSLAQFELLDPFEIVDDSQSALVVVGEGEVQLLAVSFIFIGPLLFPSVGGQFPKKNRVFGLLKLLARLDDMHVVLHLLPNLDFLHLGLPLQSAGQIFLPDHLHLLEVLVHSILVPGQLALPLLAFLLTGLQQLGLDFLPQLLLVSNYLGDEPLDGGSVLVEVADVACVCLLVFALVHFQQYFQQEGDLALLVQLLLAARQGFPQLLLREAQQVLKERLVG